MKTGSRTVLEDRSGLQAVSEVALALRTAVLQERITSTKRGSSPSIQAVTRPADDITDPAPAATCSPVDGTVVLECRVSEPLGGAR